MAVDSPSGTGPIHPACSASISRRLALAIVAFCFLMVTVGGLSAGLAWSILSGTRKIRTQSHHTQLTEAIHTRIHHLIREVDWAVIERSPERESHTKAFATQAGSRIAGLLDAHLRAEESFPEKQSEIALIRSLQNLYHDLDAATTRIMARVAEKARPDQDDLQILDAAAHQIPVLAEQLNEIHYGKIRRLMSEDVSRMKVIVGAYVAFLLVGGACVIAGIILFSQTVALPLRRLASATLDIAGGDFWRRVPIRSNDEIGQLSQSFNDMAERLQRREAELRGAQAELSRRVMETRALYRIGVEISSMLELNMILQSVVEKARALLQSEGAALCLFRAQGDGLEVRTICGSKQMSDLAVEAGQLRCLTESGGLPCSSAEPCSLCLTLDDGSAATGLAAPLMRGDEFLGVLCVGWKEARPFQPEDRELLEGLAAQAAIAIENARLYREVKALAALQERGRLAREMHDGLAQAVGYLHFRLKTLEDRLESRGQAPCAAELAEMRNTARKAYEDIRQSVFDLRTVVAKGLGLIAILTEYLHEFSQQSGIPVELQDGDARATRYSPEAEIQLIRVIQEALTNVRKHANAHHAWVWFALDGDMGRVTITDDGIGFAVKTADGTGGRRFGLQTMRERAEALGGSLEVHSSLGKGTQVVVRIPLARQGDGQ